MSRNDQRQGFIVTCASSQKKIAKAAQCNSPFGEIRIQLGPVFSGATKRVWLFILSPNPPGGRGRVFLPLSLQSSVGSRQPRLASRCADFLTNFVPRVEREGHSRQVSRHLSH